MRRSWAAAGLAGVLPLLVVDRVEAQLWPFGGYYGAPQTRRRGIRPQRRRPPAEAPAVEVPLPVARPRFPGEPPTEDGEPAATPAAPAPTATPAAKPTQPQEPRAPTPPTSGPPKPGEASKPSETAPKPTAPESPRSTTPSAPVPTGTPVSPAQVPSAPVPPEKPPELKPPAGPPAPGKPGELSKPAVAPSGARLGEVPRQPDNDATCPDRLKARGVDVEAISIGPQPDERCTVVQSVRLKSLKTPDGGTVDFPEHPTVACTTADAFSLYVRDLLSPLAKGTYGTPVTAVWTGPGLECRSRDHIFGAKLSAHGQGLAIDIAQFKLGDGRLIEVGQPKDDRGQSFETAARNAACGYFHTVLGPGSDSYHRTHWHFDLEVRGAHGDSKFCK